MVVKHRHRDSKTRQERVRVDQKRLFDGGEGERNGLDWKTIISKSMHGPEAKSITHAHDVYVSRLAHRWRRRRRRRRRESSDDYYVIRNEGSKGRGAG